MAAPNHSSMHLCTRLKTHQRREQSRYIPTQQQVGGP